MKTSWRDLTFWILPVAFVGALAWVARPTTPVVRGETPEEKNAAIWRGVQGNWATPTVSVAIPTAVPQVVVSSASRSGSMMPDDWFMANMRAEKREFEPRFEAWKGAYSGPTGAFLAFYAPEATISLAPGKTLSLKEFARNKRASSRRDRGLIVEDHSGFGGGHMGGGGLIRLDKTLFFGRANSRRGVKRDVRMIWRKRNGLWLIEHESHAQERASGRDPLPSTQRASRPEAAYFATTAKDEARFLRAVARTREDRARRALLVSYEAWKRTHSGPVEPYIALYAAEAKIHTGHYTVGGNGAHVRVPTSTRDGLLQLATDMRAQEMYDRVSDASPPQIAIAGDTAEIRARNIIAHSRDNSSHVGERRLLWRRIGGEWRIVEDWFPGSYNASRVAATPIMPALSAVQAQPTFAPNNATAVRFSPDDRNFLARAKETRTNADTRAVWQSYAKWKQFYYGPFASYDQEFAPDARVLVPSSIMVTRAQRGFRFGEPNQINGGVLMELSPPRLAVRGDKAELRVFTRHHPPSGNSLNVTHRLTWRKINGVWRIVEDYEHYDDL